jgi:hypothetical protein
MINPFFSISSFVFAGILGYRAYQAWMDRRKYADDPMAYPVQHIYLAIGAVVCTAMGVFFATNLFLD